MGDMLFFEDMLKLMANLFDIQRFKMELQTARQDSHRQLLRIGSRQQELNVRGRLFERFQQGVKTVARQHVHFVNQIDLKATARWRVLDVIQQVTGVFDFGA